MSSTKNPIRVGIIGLSPGGGWAPVSHLPYLQNSSKYTITAGCNSTLESGNKAFEQYNLPTAAKAYDSVESMCDSDTVDLVVCIVVVFSHYKLVKPAIDRGKVVYVEWPLCGTTEEAKELAQLAKEKSIWTIIGFQGRAGHVHSILREILDSGRIGQDLATHIIGSSTTLETGNCINKR
jgi:predicted dehydrogenase